MVLNGDAEKRIWIIEFGWSTANQANGDEYSKDTTDARRASYLVRASPTYPTRLRRPR